MRRGGVSTFPEIVTDIGGRHAFDLLTLLRINLSKLGDHIDTTVSDHKTAGGPSGDIDFDKNYQEEEYSNRKLLLKRTWFAVKVSEGVYTHPVEEHIFTHQGTRLMSQRIKKYNAAGDVLSDKPYDFTTSGNKVRKELAP